MDNRESALTSDPKAERSDEPSGQVSDNSASAAPSSGFSTTAPHSAISPATVAMPIMMPNGLSFQTVPMGVPGVSVQQVQVWHGQFPPPEAVERYNAVLPGAFDRIIGMAERQLEASIQGAAEARQYLREDSRRGHWLGWFVTVSAIGGAIFCATIHEAWVAGLLVAVPVMGVAKALIDSAKTRPTESAGIQPPLSVATKPDAPEPPVPTPDNAGK